MSNQNKYVSVPTITASFAQELLAKAATAAAEAQKPMAISIVDRDGNLKAFVRMDGAPLLSVEISQNKAYTAAAFGLPTDAWFNFIKDDEPLRLGIVHTNRLITYGGGYPIVVDGSVVGGIGASGGHYLEDMAVVNAALKSVGLG
jgi:uncharacterized protein GlcG (DUF336 family)